MRAIRRCRSDIADDTSFPKLRSVFTLFLAVLISYIFCHGVALSRARRIKFL
jgi:hypothetical protein